MMAEDDPKAPFRRLIAAFESLTAPREKSNYSSMMEGFKTLMSQYIDSLTDLDPYFLARAGFLYMWGEDNKTNPEEYLRLASSDLAQAKELIDLPLFEPPAKVKNIGTINLIEAIFSYYRRLLTVMRM